MAVAVVLDAAARKQERLVSIASPWRTINVKTSATGQDSVSPTTVDDRTPEIDMQPLILCEPNPNADQNYLITVSLSGYKEHHFLSFVWGCHNGDAFCRLIDDTYNNHSNPLEKEPIQSLT